MLGGLGTVSNSSSRGPGAPLWSPKALTYLLDSHTDTDIKPVKTKSLKNTCCYDCRIFLVSLVGFWVEPTSHSWDDYKSHLLWIIVFFMCCWISFVKDFCIILGKRSGTVISLSCVVFVLDTSVRLGSFYLFHPSEEIACMQEGTPHIHVSQTWLVENIVHYVFGWVQTCTPQYLGLGFCLGRLLIAVFISFVSTGLCS